MSRNWTGSQVPREKVYGNFRQPRWRVFTAHRDWRKEREGMSDRHLALIRQLSCTLCPSPIVDVHHLKSLAAAKERGIGLKATDQWSVPLCRLHHSDVERIGSRKEPAWFAEYGIDPHELAYCLWRATGHLGRMRRVLLAHQLQASAKVAEDKFRQRGVPR